MSIKTMFCLVLLWSAHAFAHPRKAVVTPASPAPPSEVRRTVDAVVGRWLGSMTATVPGTPPQSFPWSMDCRPAALHSAAICTMEGQAPIGELAQACLVAWDPESGTVHYMCATSMGEVHDHKGRWE